MSTLRLNRTLTTEPIAWTIQEFLEDQLDMPPQIRVVASELEWQRSKYPLKLEPSFPLLSRSHLGFRAFLLDDGRFILCLGLCCDSGLSRAL